MNRVQPNTTTQPARIKSVYEATISQNSTNDPTVLETHLNTLTELYPNDPDEKIHWIRDGVGIYSLYAPNQFMGENQCTVYIQNSQGAQSTTIFASRTSNNTITVKSYDNTFTLADGLLAACFIKITNFSDENILNNQIKQEQSLYKVYTALLTQTGTNNPVATILNNTIGNITWVRNATGAYEGNYTPGFPLEKTTLTINTAYNNMMFYLANFETGEPSTQVLLKTYETAGNALSINDGLLYYAFIEIKIYN